jgi:mannitol operon repressor
MVGTSRTEFRETNPHLAEFIDYLSQLNKESARGQVLISASMLDDLLKRTAKAFLRDCDSADRLFSGFNAPIGTFSSRVELCHSLGLINDAERHDANCIRKVRNAFAHSISASFEDESVRNLCRTLKFSAKDYVEVKVNTRGQFSTAATCLILNLTNRPHYVRQKRLSAQSWPY